MRFCPFKAFIVEDGPNQAFPYPGDYGYAEHAEHSLLSSFVAGIAWSYSRSPNLELRVVFDASDNDVDRASAWSLPAALEAEISNRRFSGGKPYPKTKVCSVELIDSNPLRVESAHWGDSELIQLCDILLGATFDALGLEGRTRNKSGRIRLAKSVSQVLAETLETPWMQQIPVHRRFSVSLYPDEFNLAYPAYLSRIRSQDSQDAPLQPELRPLIH